MLIDCVNQILHHNPTFNFKRLYFSLEELCLICAQLDLVKFLDLTRRIEECTEDVT